jgi:hypothetical protein
MMIFRAVFFKRWNSKRETGNSFEQRKSILPITSPLRIIEDMAGETMTWREI